MLLNKEDLYYIELAELIHNEIVMWDPYGLIEGGAPEDEHYSIEMRLISGLINMKTEEEIIDKTIKSWESYGTDFSELNQVQKSNLKMKILQVINSVKAKTKFN